MDQANGPNGTPFPLVDYLDSHSGWVSILPDIVKNTSVDERGIYSKKMKEKINPNYVKSSSTLYTSLTSKIKTSGLYFGMFSGISGSLKKSTSSDMSSKNDVSGSSEDVVDLNDFSNVMLGSSFATQLGFEVEQT